MKRSEKLKIELRGFYKKEIITVVRTKYEILVVTDKRFLNKCLFEANDAICEAGCNVQNSTVEDVSSEIHRKDGYKRKPYAILIPEEDIDTSSQVEKVKQHLLKIGLEVEIHPPVERYRDA